MIMSFQNYSLHTYKDTADDAYLNDNDRLCTGYQTLTSFSFNMSQAIVWNQSLFLLIPHFKTVNLQS